MTSSHQRLEILLNAAQTGDIWELTYGGGPIWVRAGKVDLGDEKDRGDQALYVDELREMVRLVLVERRGKDYYRLTGNGFNAAKQALIKLQETPTRELVGIVRERAERYQKPRGAIWNELTTRFSWPGCPKEDSTLIGSLDSFLRPLNNGHTMLPPRIRNDPNVGVPPPPPYYRNKVSLSQVLNLPTAQSNKPSSANDAQVIALKSQKGSTEERAIKHKEARLPEQTDQTFQDVLRKPLLNSRYRVPIAVVVVSACGLFAMYAILPDEIKLNIFNWLIKTFHF